MNLTVPWWSYPILFAGAAGLWAALSHALRKRRERSP